MSIDECEKIIDQVTDPRHLNDQCRQHIRGCRECAAVIACMVWARGKGSPTADLQPSSAFLSRIDQALSGGGNGGGGAAVAGGGSNLLLWVLGIVITATILTGVVAFNGLSPAGNEADLLGKSGSAMTTGSAAESESRILNTQQHAPTLKFPSPADDVD